MTLFTCTVGSHLPHPHHRIGIITPDKLPVPFYRPRGVDSLVSYSMCVCTWLARGHYTIKSKGSSENLTQVVRPKSPLDTNEPTTPYIIGWELNLRRLLVRQWKSNPQPLEHLRPMTIKTHLVIILFNKQEPICTNLTAIYWWLIMTKFIN